MTGWLAERKKSMTYIRLSVPTTQNDLNVLSPPPSPGQQRASLSRNTHEQATRFHTRRTIGL